MKKVVAIAFIQDDKFLIVQTHKSVKNNSWTLIGGGVEDGETIVEAAIREVKEEIHNGFRIYESDLKLLGTFEEQAVTDPSLTIEMSLFICKRCVDVELIPNEEILTYHWYKIGEDYHLSNTIKNHFIPFFIDNVLKNY